MRRWLLGLFSIAIIFACKSNKKETSDPLTIYNETSDNGSCLEVLPPEGVPEVAPSPFRVGSCPGEISVAGIKAALVKKCDPYVDSRNNDPNQYTWFFYASRLNSDGSRVQVTEEQAISFCQNLQKSVGG